MELGLEFASEISISSSLISVYRSLRDFRVDLLTYVMHDPAFERIMGERQSGESCEQDFCS